MKTEKYNSLLELSLGRLKSYFKTDRFVAQTIVEENVMDLYLDLDYGLLETEEGYKEIFNLIETSSINFVEASAKFYHDLSGYEYWVKTMQENNRITFSIKVNGNLPNDKISLIFRFYSEVVRDIIELKKRHSLMNYYKERIIHSLGVEIFKDENAFFDKIYLLRRDFKKGSEVPSLLLQDTISGEEVLLSFEEIVKNCQGIFLRNFDSCLRVLKESTGVEGNTVKEVTGKTLEEFTSDFIATAVANKDTYNPQLEWSKYFHFNSWMNS